MGLTMYPSHDRWEDVDELTEIAGTAKTQPSPPEGGIPRQWLPAFIRWPIRLLVLPFVYLDLLARWVATKCVRLPYRQVGHCHQRGNCCYYVLLPKPKGLATRFFYFWFTQVNGFYRRQKESVKADGKDMVVMGCRYLQKDGRCGHYRLRPTLCREWPLIRYFGYPRRLKGCGFHAVPNVPKAKPE